MFHSDIFEVNSPHVRIILRQPFHTLSMLPTLHPMCSVWNSHVCWSMSNPSIHSSIHPSIQPSIHPCNSLKLLITIIYCYDMIAVLVTIYIYIITYTHQFLKLTKSASHHAGFALPKSSGMTWMPFATRRRTSSTPTCARRATMMASLGFSWNFSEDNPCQKRP